MKVLLFIALFVCSAFSGFSQISYMSKVYEARPYQEPVNLELMERVLTHKNNTAKQRIEVLNELTKDLHGLISELPEDSKAFEVAVNYFNGLILKINELDLYNHSNYLWAKNSLSEMRSDVIKVLKAIRNRK